MISTRIPEELEQLVIRYANKHKWSKSFTVGEILRKFFYEYELTNKGMTS